MKDCLHPCTYITRNFPTDFSMACHKFNGSSSKSYVGNIIYSHDSMHSSFCASEHFTSVFAYLPHGSVPGIILVCLDKRRVK